MPPVVKRIDVRRYDAAKMQKLNLFQTSRFFCDIYCLLPEQAQKPHAHADADKLYVVLEGTVVAAIDDEVVTLTAGDSVLAPAGSAHGISNPGAVAASLLVFMAPHP
jgi:mannose-6-phosphate isomerase-like protein (cupin superfamily)